jgi:Alkylmercury lyase
MSIPSPSELRKYIFDSFIQDARAPLIEEIMKRFGLGREEAGRLLRDLQSAHHILLLPGTHRILMANPFSNLPTPFRVTANSKVYYANCAWDAIALHLVLELDTRIHSYCHHCGTAIEFGLSGGKRSSDEGGNALVYLGTPVSKWYENLLLTCSNTMVFFASSEHFTEWQESNPGAGGVTLSVDKMIEVAAPISKGRSRLDYQMPSKAQLMSHWESIGIRGPFWTF